MSDALAAPETLPVEALIMVGLVLRFQPMSESFEYAAACRAELFKRSPGQSVDTSGHATT
jgi:hypothetical protein